MDAAPRRGLSTPGATAVVLATTSLVALMLYFAPNGAVSAALEDGLLVIAALGAVAVLLRKARQDRRYGHIWSTLAIAAGLFGAAELYWFAVEVVLGEPVLAASLADVLYFGGYVGLTAAWIRSFPGRPTKRTQVRLALDAVIVLTSMAGVLWILLIREMAHDPTMVLEAVIVAAYPAIDLALLTLLLFLLRDIRGVHRPAVMLFSVMLALWAVVDMAYAAQVLEAGAVSGRTINALWVGGYVAFAVSAYVHPGVGPASAPPRAEWWANMVYIPVPVAAGLAVWAYIDDGGLGPVLFTLGILLMVALASRQVLVTLELLAVHRRTQDQAHALEEAQSIAHVGSWDYDFATETAAFSPEARRICGLEPGIAGVPRERFLEMVPLDHRSEHDRERFDQGRMPNFEVEHPIQRPDGERRQIVQRGWVEFRNGRPVRAFGTMQDVTERNAFVDRLRFQAHLLDSVGQATIATDMEGRITYWNRAAEDIYGWSRDEVLGRPVVEVTPSKAMRKQAEEIMERMVRGEAWSGEFEVQRKDGSSFLAEVHNTPVTDDGGQTIGIIGVSQDISGRKKMEVDLRERLKELRALYSVAAAAAKAEKIPPVLQACVDALGPAFLHDDTWILVEIGRDAASSAKQKPDGAVLVKEFQTDAGKGWLEVRYRSRHEDQDLGPFIKEEVDLLDAVAEVLRSCADRIQALEELASREAALAQAQRLTKIGAWKWLPKEDVATWSDEMFEIFEHPRERGPAGIEEALGFFTEKSRAALRPELERVAEQGGSYVLELEASLASGRIKTVISRGEAVTNSKGRVVEIRGTVQDITEWKRNQEDLRFQADLLNEVRHAVIATDLEGAITYWNPAASTVFGWDAQDVVGQPVSDVLGERQTDEFAEEGTVDQWMQRKDGTSILVNLSSSSLIDAEGRLAGFIGLAQDVTKDRATQRQYQELVEHSPNGILRTTPEGSLEYANPAAAALLGYESADQLKIEITDMQDLYIEPDERTRFLERLEDNEAEPFQTRLRRRDGAPLWAEIRARLHRRPDGTTFVEGTFHDLTAERMQAELSQRLAAIVESAEEAIYSKDLDGVVETWNHGAERTFGYTADEAIGRKFRDIAVPDDLLDEYQDMMRRVREGQVVRRFETVRQRKDGSRIDYSLAVTPVRDASGKIVAASVSGFDISDRKRAEEAERAQIENQHLKEVDKALRDFINAAAHDLSQPLTPMRLSLSVLKTRADDLPEFAHRTVAMLERSVDRMALLLEDLLDVARLESGTLQFDIKDTPLPVLLHETADFFEAQAQERHVELVVNDDFQCAVTADPRRVTQVLFNFVGNALKFTPRGGKITISSRKLDGLACVEVRDTGPGLTPEQRGKLFKAFSQVHGPGGPKGTGLGLYISRGIIEKHGGEVGVASDGQGKGSTFWFTLQVASCPVHEEDADAGSRVRHG